MNEPLEHRSTLTELTLRAIDGELSESDAEQLAHRLSEDPEAREEYIRLMQICGIGAQVALGGASGDGSANAQFPFTLPVSHLAEVHRFSRISWRSLKFAAMIVLSAGIAGGAWLLFRTPVATLSATGLATFDPPLKLHQVLPNTPMFLREGVARITLNNGVALTLEAPSHFQIDSDMLIHLDRGRLSAKVSHQGRGFTVQTPNATVTDLGTEFGVAVSERSTDVHVFLGRVRTSRAVASSITSGPETMTLVAGQSVHIEGQTLTLDPHGARPDQFATTTAVEKLDFADLVSGGNGTTRRRNIAIDVLTGGTGHLVPYGTVQTDHQYHSVTSLPFVDGCFIPDGGLGSVTVDSRGDTFAFPPTSGKSFDQIWTGGSVPVSQGFKKVGATLDGVDFSGSGHSLIFLGGNKGLTINLAQIRAAHQGRAILRFESGIWLTAPDMKKTSPADAYVLVDGQIRFIKSHMTSKDGLIQVTVPITNKDRFLTLAATTDAQNVTCTGILWTDTTLEILSDEKK